MNSTWSNKHMYKTYSFINPSIKHLIPQAFSYLNVRKCWFDKKNFKSRTSKKGIFQKEKEEFLKALHFFLSSMQPRFWAILLAYGGFLVIKWMLSKKMLPISWFARI